MVRSLLSVCLLLIVSLSFAPKGQVSGEITNNHNKALAGVSIKIKSATGNVDETYTITVNANTATDTTFSYVGYQDKFISGLWEKAYEMLNPDVLPEI